MCHYALRMRVYGGAQDAGTRNKSPSRRGKRHNFLFRTDTQIHGGLENLKHDILNRCGGDRGPESRGGGREGLFPYFRQFFTFLFVFIFCACPRSHRARDDGQWRFDCGAGARAPTTGSPLIIINLLTLLIDINYLS